MPVFQVTTPQRTYPAVVERGAIECVPKYLPAGHGSIFIVSTRDVWEIYGPRFLATLGSRKSHTIFFSGGEDHKRISHIERMAEQMVDLGADRSSLVIALGGGIVTDMAGFLAAIFMRGIPVIQIPTTLLAQVDAAVGGKTGVNLVAGKNLVGSFHQPLAVLIDPSVLASLPQREYHAGLYEIIKSGVIRSEPLFRSSRSSATKCWRRSPRWWITSSPNRCGSRPRSCQRTSASPVCAAFSISATPSVMRSKRRPATRGSCMARPFPGACALPPISLKAWRCWRRPTAPRFMDVLEPLRADSGLQRHRPRGAPDPAAEGQENNSAPRAFRAAGEDR